MHLNRTKTTSKCEDAYSSEELKTFEDQYKKNDRTAKKNYKQKNPEKVAEQTKIYRQNNSSKIAQYKKEWYRRKKQDLGNQFLKFIRLIIVI